MSWVTISAANNICCKYSQSMCLQRHFMNRPWMAGWLKNIHFEDRRNNFHSMLFPEASWFGCKLFLFYMKSLQSHPIILLSGWIKLFSVSGSRGKGKNMIWKQKGLQNNYNLWQHITNQLFIAWISFLLFADVNCL